MDHEWGPRLQLFLSPGDYEAFRRKIDLMLREKLPLEFRGFSVNFSKKDPDDGFIKRMEKKKEYPVNHHITFYTIEHFFKSYLGVDPYNVNLYDWLIFAEESLLEVTEGKVYYDGLNELKELRQRFSYFPEDIWRYKLACQWKRISQEEAFAGRCGQTGDELGSRIIAARLVRDIMKLCFLMERKYAPYSKWIGKAFQNLHSGKTLIPLLNSIMEANKWKKREKYLCEAYVYLASMHNKLEITPPVDFSIKNYFERPYMVIFADRFSFSIMKSIKDEKLRNFKYAIGSADQFADCTDLTDCPELMNKLRTLYDSK